MSEVVYLKNHQHQHKSTDRIQIAEDQLEILEKANDALESQLNSIRSPNKLGITDYLLLGVMAFVMYITPIYLSIPVFLATMWWFNR